METHGRIQRGAGVLKILENRVAMFPKKFCIRQWDTSFFVNIKTEIVFMKHYAPKHELVHHPIHQVIYSPSYFSWPNLRLLRVAVTVSEISLLQVFNVQICKGQ